MTIKAKDGLYEGGTGWPSDGELFAKVTVTWKQWLGHAGQHLQVAQLLLTEVHRHDAMIRSLRDSDVRSARLPPSVSSSYFFHCALAIENALKGVIAFNTAVSIEQMFYKAESCQAFC